MYRQWLPYWTVQLRTWRIIPANQDNLNKNRGLCHMFKCFLGATLVPQTFSYLDKSQTPIVEETLCPFHR